MFVEQLLKPGGIAVALRTRHRRDQVVDDGRMRPAFGLRALARIIDQERVDQGQVAECGVGTAVRRHANAFTG